MKITSSLIDKLIRLRSGESLPSSALRGEWVEELLSDGVLISRSHGSRSCIIAASPDTLEKSLMHINERLGHLDKMKETLDAETTRSEQAAETGNSKLVTARSCPGFPVNSYEPIICCLNGKKLVVNPQEGTFLFIADWHSFAIPADVTVVNIENMENFRLIRRQQSLFASALAGKRLLFVSRYPQSSDLRTWLQTIPNQYVHFGDFDLAGIHIFLTEFQKHLGTRASFLIPQDIEQLIKHGSAERYNDQYPKFCHLTSNIPPLQQLIDMLHKYHRCYDQEGYIENSLTEHHIT